MLREDLRGMRLIDDLQHKYDHRLVVQPLSTEVRVWFLQLTHRNGTPVIRGETEHLASGFAALLDAAQYDGFWDEPAEREQEWRDVDR